MKISPYLSGILQSESALRAFQLGAAAIAIGLIFWQLQFSTSAICCGDFDGYYHIKWSRMLWESLRNHTFPPTFSWLPLTTLDSKHYVDHHLLFHFFQMPFTWFGDLRLGAKISATIFASLFVAVSLPAQHGQGAALRDHLSHHWNSPAVHEEILAAAAIELCLWGNLR